MANLTIRNLDERLKGRLRVRAASLGRSMEEEARRILQAALDDSLTPPSDLANRIRSRFAKLGDVRLPIATREPVREQRLPEDASAIALAVVRKPRASKAKRRA